MGPSPSPALPAMDRSLLLACVLLLGGCGDDPAPVNGPGPDPDPPAGGVALEVVVSGLEAPVHVSSPADDPRLFVVEVGGRVRIVEDGVLRSQPFLDLTGRVSSGGERGLLSIAFHPRYAENGRFFVAFTDREGGALRVEALFVSEDPSRADPASASLVLRVPQPFSNHNGGLATFGPDGMLYVGLGDGGGVGDPMGHGQDPTTLLGSILRLDVDAGPPYAVPPDNPFVAGGGAPEVWVYGLRNPWRFSFDAEDGRLWIGDVGQHRREEIDAVEPEGGLNFGWNVTEGTECYQSASCDRTGLVEPVLEYGHDDGCSVTGGHVYRGSAVPDLEGRYVFGDYCGGWVRSFRLEDGAAEDLTTHNLGDVGRILSFGLDAEGELYLLSTDGTVYRFVPEG